MKTLFVSFTQLFLYSFFFIASSIAGEVESLPSLEKSIEDVRVFYKDKGLSFLAEKEFLIQKY